MRKIILFFLLFCALIANAQSPLSRFNVVVSGNNTLTFSDSSTGSPTNFAWEFVGGNPATSTSSNPVVTYATQGSYTAKLTVSNSSGSSVSTRTVKITTGNIIDLSTGRNNDGTLMPELGAADSDWTYTNPSGLTSTPVTRHANVSGWSSASTGGVAGITRWITGNNVMYGDHYYASKEFEIPEGVTTAVLNLRTLSFVRSWTYLVKKNTNGTESETLITNTVWQNDGAKGWLNSRNPEVINYPLAAGKYFIKVKVFTNNSEQRQATDTNANVNFGNAITISPIAEFSATPTSAFVGNNVQFTNMSQGVPASLLWKFEDGANILTSTNNNPVVAFSTVGSHYAELNADYGNSLLSSLRINNYIQTVTQDTPVVAVTQPSCSVPSGTITVTSPTSGVTYSFDNGVTFQSSNILSGLSSGTYSVRVKNSGGVISQSTNAVIDPVLNAPANPVLSITQPSCAVTTGTITVTSPSAGVEYSFDGGVNFQTSNTKAGVSTGHYTIMVRNSAGCTSSLNAVINTTDCRDWTKAPNSYVFDPSQNNDGLYIPVKKAYEMWRKDAFLSTSVLPNGNVTADVLWEDEHGLIKSGTNYNLELVDSGDNAKIKVPVNKSKKGNAVVAFRINGEIFWSWHVWVTDDPSNGSTYKSYTGVRREKSDGTLEVIPDAEWGWMDRNLGAISNSNTSGEWNKNGGLLYQWGRKDPIPSLVDRGNDFYEVSGSIGRVRHRQAKNFDNAQNFDNLRQFVPVSNATVDNNIKLSVKNPLSLIYVNKDDNSGPAYYNNNANLMINWFGKTATLPDSRLTELNLWSDNSKGKVATNYNFYSANTPYRNKSSFDPCPNGWRIPSMLVSNLASGSYVDDIRVDYSPFGVRTTLGKNAFESNGYHIIKPNDNNVAAFMTGFKLYPNIGFDLSNAGGFDMGVFPGTGGIAINAQGGQYADQHHIGLWTATMSRHFDATPAVGARALFMVPDKGQPDIPDSGNPTIKGRYWYEPLAVGKTSDANGCRCIKDPLYAVNDYNFPTEYIASNSEYTVGLDGPNTYQVVKAAVASVIEIPVSKAFSVQSQLLNNPDILNASNFNALKVNVLWATNTNLINTVNVINPSPGSLADLANSKIVVNVNPNQSGNAVVTLHNGSITNPVYWSWHIWVTDTAIGSNVYATEIPNATATNYVNYVPKGDVLKTEFMDRNLGAIDVFPTVANPLAPTVEEYAKIKVSTGLQYQWGRKDPIPSFQYADRSSYDIFLGNANSNGAIAYTTLNATSYNNMSGSYIIPYNTYTNTSNANILANDKVNDKVAKVLSYSVKNPLVYMIPSSFAPLNNAIPNYTNGTDWLLDEPNVANDRWGRGGKKSPFDPCPEGWRIPDLTGVAIVSNKDFGMSPWYKKDKMVATSYNLVTDYLGTQVKNSANSSIGFMFNNPAYTVGNYPNAPARGIRSVTANQTPVGTYGVNSFEYSGVWTAAMNSNYIGRPINILFDAASATDRFIAFHDNNDPYFGMSCRCVKVNYNQDGLEEGPIPAIPVTPGPSMKASNIFSKAEISEKVKENKIVLFPNPVKDVLHIKATENKDYYYQIYNASGQLVKSGKFENTQTSVSSLVQGVYLVRINNSEALVKIIKK